MRLHICNGCGKEKMLDERVRHWHDCHPAKFVYMVKSDKILASQMVSAAQPRVQPTVLSALEVVVTCPQCSNKIVVEFAKSRSG